MIQEIIVELNLTTPTRQVVWTVNPLPGCFADRNLLKLVWSNLLNNAHKFTRYRIPAEIVINTSEADTESIFSIRDNGTGFDMQYSDKLFGVFERLHRPDEYEGTGIGLALVQRIIHRHHGRIWAESEVDKGATFYFSVPHLDQEVTLEK
jgi:light-regulated signal transduction histidine kinase (bacteriophytochrome)